MRRLELSFVMFLLSVLPSAAYIHVDYDYYGATMAESAYIALAQAEGRNTESIIDILDHYTSAEVAAAGIWTSKFLERKVIKDEGLFGSAENKYYKVILFLVQKRITPRIIRVGKYLLDYPEQFLYWGPYLFKVCEDVINLCEQFEAIVTNGKLSFSGVNFLQLSPALQEYFDFSKLGNVNWQQTWDRLINFPTPKWEDFREDFKELFSSVSPVNLAIAGEEDIRGRATHIFDKFAEAPESLPDLFNQVQDAFSEVTSGAAIKSILEGVVGDLKDSLAVERLFGLGRYNVSSYVNDYVSQLKGQFYTQRWYIYHYEDDVNNPNNYYYTQIYRICYYQRWYGSRGSGRQVLWSAEYDSRTNLSEFENKVTEQYNQFYDSFRRAYYGRYFGYYGYPNIVVETDAQVQHYGGGGDKVEVVDYEELFDSRINHEIIFEKEFNKRIETLMKDQEVSYPQTKVEYFIGKGDKIYYEVESAETVKNTSTASITVTCRDEVELAKGGFNFKVNERYNSSKMNEYAYPKGMIPEKQPEDVTAWEEKIDDLEKKIEAKRDEIDGYQQQIDGYQQQIDNLQAIADTTTNAVDKSNLRNQISSLKNQISSLQRNIRNLESTIDTLQDQLDEVNEVYENYQIDYNDDLDGPYRIPTLENDLAGDFRIHWDDSGSWYGHTYTRSGHIVGMEYGVKFIAEVSQQRREMRFLGIRYHRAIIGVEYRLVSENESSEVVDVIKLTDDMSDKEKADLINNRRSEIQQEFPSCSVKVIKNEKDGIEKDTPDEALHLLWMSDRIALARFIEYRLRQIDGQLAFIERNLHVKKNVLDDFKKAFLQGVPRWRTSSPTGAALQRWLDIGNGISSN